MTFEVQEFEMYEVIDSETGEVKHRSEDRDEAESYADQLNNQQTTAQEAAERAASEEPIVLDVGDQVKVNDDV